MAFSFSPDIDALIVAAAGRYGIDPDALRAIARIESAGDPQAQNPNSSAGGLFQFINATAQDYGLEDRFDPAQAADAGARLARDNAERLRGVLGRDPTAGELYLAHQQGGGGASRLLRDPNVLAVDIVGEDAVSLNGGNANMTAGDFANIWISRADGLANGGGVAAGAPAHQPNVAGQVPQNAFQQAVARVSGSQQQDAGQPQKLSFQDRLSGVGSALLSLDQGGPVSAPLQGHGGTIDLSSILDRARSSGLFKQQKGFSL